MKLIVPVRQIAGGEPDALEVAPGNPLGAALLSGAACLSASFSALLSAVRLLRMRALCASLGGLR
eukprot:4075510-Pyramimonas_sp.AAC.1